MLGADGVWLDETPLTVRRDELPVLDCNRAESLLRAFEALMDETGSGYALTLRLVDKFFRAGGGRHDRLVLAQISGNAEPILWS